jgi:hypothetical protein
MIWLVMLLVLAGLGCLLACRLLRRRGLHLWLGDYVRNIPKRRKHATDEPVHLILCLADHFEPKWGNASPEVARQRVENWVRDYPRQFGAFRDSDGRPPRHTFFFPLEEYEPEHLDALGHLCREGFGEVEVHLHHDHDTAEALRDKLLKFKEILVKRHGLLARRRETGEEVYGFIHGNWALNNSRPDGRWCGVDRELEVLRDTGCYADFTFPSAPSLTQPRKINSIYYAPVDKPGRGAQDSGVDVGTAPVPPNSLMLIQGPLLLDWRRRKWGVVPRIENGCVQDNQAPSARRLDLWLKARVQVPARPDWFFVKLHTHGGKESNQQVLLGAAMVRFHQALAQLAADNPDFHFHYVTAREMFNLVRAAEGDWQGCIASARDLELIPA